MKLNSYCLARWSLVQPHGLHAKVRRNLGERPFTVFSEICQVWPIPCSEFREDRVFQFSLDDDILMLSYDVQFPPFRLA
jgi:hypothetical protein